LTQRGHAIELRIYAEDPASGYLPQAGPLALYREPVMPGIRIDSGFVEGDEVSVHYDPLIAKLIASGETREAARRRAIAALQSFSNPWHPHQHGAVTGAASASAIRLGRHRHAIPRRRQQTDSANALSPATPPEALAVAAAVSGEVPSARSSIAYDPWSSLRDTRP
jgi:acetyl/propionyl-CoA carboxylase alpha subunit